VNAAGTAFVYAGYIGGSAVEYGTGIAVDAQASAYVAGRTSSTEATFPAVVGPDLTYNGGAEDAFVAKLSAAGALSYAGYIGGAGQDLARGVAVDSAGNAYVTGQTPSSQASFPVTVGPDLTHNGDVDAFVAKVNAAGTALVYAGYIGGSGGDRGFGIAVDSGGNAHVTGITSSTETTFPHDLGPDPSYNGGFSDGFVAKVSPGGTALVYAGYIGGAELDEAFGIATDAVGHAFVTGVTASPEATFPVTVGPDLIYNGNGDAFVVKISLSPASRDFDANGVPDVLWQEDANRLPVVWFMGGFDGSFPITGKAISGPVLGWKLVASADLDRNGKPDLLWQEDASRAISVWYMGGVDGTVILSAKGISGPIPGWRLAASADLDLDDRPDLLWQEDGTGVLVVWFMGGVDGSVPVSGKLISGVIPGWRMVAAADLDGNGRQDLLWQEDANRLPVVWYMGGPDGTIPLSGKAISSPIAGWRMVAAADLDRSGKPDLLWQEDANRVLVVWYMGGVDGSIPLSGKVISGPIPGWTVVGPK
jgi:hypothetical protein